MRRLIALAVGVIAMLSVSGVPIGALANPALHAADGAVVDGQGQRVLPRCVNLSPWLVPEGYLVAPGSLAALTTSPSRIKQRLVAVVGQERADAFWRAWIKAFIDEADFRRLKSQGFNCVRLPLNARYIANRIDASGVTFDPDGIAPVDNAVAWSAATGLFVVLDLHDAPGGQNVLSTVSDVPSTDHTARLWEGPTAAANRQRTIALWRALAARYAHASAIGGYDLLNEPALPKDVPGDMLARLYGEITAAIRTADPDHMIIAEGNNYAHDFSTLQSLTDGNVMYEFHEYAIGNAAWRSPGAAALAPFLQLRQLTGRPLWLGEFGENTAAWQAQVVGLLKAQGIGWAIWPWKRVDLGAGHPVVEAIEAPLAWKSLGDYLVGRWFARSPSPAEAEQAMTQMLVAVRTGNCRQDASLAAVLGGN